MSGKWCRLVFGWLGQKSPVCRASADRGVPPQPRNFARPHQIADMSPFFTNADQSVIWLVDHSYPGHRSDGVLCSLNLLTDRFGGPSGPHPAVVTETGGFKPTR